MVLLSRAVLKNWVFLWKLIWHRLFQISGLSLESIVAESLKNHRSLPRIFRNLIFSRFNCFQRVSFLLNPSAEPLPLNSIWLWQPSCWPCEDSICIFFLLLLEAFFTFSCSWFVFMGLVRWYEWLLGECGVVLVMIYYSCFHDLMWLNLIQISYLLLFCL